MGAPSTSARRLDDAPGHGDGTATDDHADRQESEALPQRRGVHGEGEMATGGVGPGHHPAEQRGKTQGHLQAVPFAAPFGATFAPGTSIQVAKPSAGRNFGAPKQIGRGDATVRKAKGWARTMP